ncbi:diguanylate cyclase [Rhizobacter sp. Root404]|uniref:GGDEF domain-containing protein n=1 Tax=Rhizobacter sp. Root404 TaxID=1736528 RepID=UPI00071568CD|nr:tetratricopeptide repeat-containing diguanylate cyclase [Rhizobacter sp. Root404]KQW36546.1 hypothetical protein ASC76_17955 [Rhizobacter sp. Root404]
MLRESHFFEDSFENLLRRAQEAVADLRYEDALTQVLHALKLAEDAGDDLQQSRAHAKHSRILSRLSLYAEAVSAAYSALRFAGNDPAQGADALGALGTANQTLTPPEGHFKHYDEMLAKARQAGDASLEASAVRGMCIANLMSHQKHFHEGRDKNDPAMLSHASEALRLALEALRISRDTGDERSAYLGQHLQVGALIASGDLAAARGVSEQMLVTSSATVWVAESGSDRAIALKHLGDLDMLDGRLDDAESRMTQALAICESHRDVRKAADCFTVLSDISERKGDYKAALEWQRRSFDAFMQFASASARAHASATAVREGAERARAFAALQQERADRLEHSNQELALEAKRHASAALQDALTGIANRRCLDTELAALMNDRRGRGRCSLALLDIDHFKWVNDTFLHTTGDKVLRRIGAVLRECSREKDVVARFGGEEFAVIFVDIDPLEVAGACDRIRRAIADVAWSEVQPDLTVTVSLGFAHFDEAGGDVDELVKVADGRLFQAKRAGRNRAVGP